jgi:hypothetical protein
MDDRTDPTTLSKLWRAPLAGFCQDQIEAAVNLQKDLLAALRKPVMLGLLACSRK